MLDTSCTVSRCMGQTVLSTYCCLPSRHLLSSRRPQSKWRHGQHALARYWGWSRHSWRRRRWRHLQDFLTIPSTITTQVRVDHLRNRPCELRPSAGGASARLIDASLRFVWTSRRDAPPCAPVRTLPRWAMVSAWPHCDIHSRHLFPLRSVQAASGHSSEQPVQSVPSYLGDQKKHIMTNNLSATKNAQKVTTHLHDIWGIPYVHVFFLDSLSSSLLPLPFQNI